MKILIAEDERDLLELLRDNLIREGHEVLTAENGAAAWRLFQLEQADLCILDVMMPGMNGLELVQKIRERSEAPVLFLTARGEETDRVLGLSLGADDYLVKPFSMAELKARVQIQCRHLQKYRANQSSDHFTGTVLTCGALKLNVDEAACSKDGSSITLGAKEFQILRLLMENQGRVFTKKQIYNSVWQDSYLYDDNTVMVHLSRLRSKIEDDPKVPVFLKTIRGLGYKLSAPPASEGKREHGREQ